MESGKEERVLRESLAWFKAKNEILYIGYSHFMNMYACTCGLEWWSIRYADGRPLPPVAGVEPVDFYHGKDYEGEVFLWKKLLDFAKRSDLTILPRLCSKTAILKKGTTAEEILISRDLESGEVGCHG